MYDLGDTVGLAVTVKDAANAPSNAVSVVLTITLPDGTTATPAVVNPPSVTGTYVCDYVPTMSGRHGVRWVFTSPAAAFADVFDVRSTAPAYLLSLSAAKDHLNIPASITTDDEEIREHIEAATAYIEQRCGPVVRRTYTEVVDPGIVAPYGSVAYPYATLHRQVLSVTSLTPIVTGVAWSAGLLALIDVDGPSGMLRLKPGGVWPVTPYRLVYVCGRTEIPANLAMAAKMLVKWSWETQRGTIATPLSVTEGGPSPYSGMVPSRVGSLVSSSLDLSGFA